MSFFLNPIGLESRSPLIKAAERTQFTDALALLDAAADKSSRVEAEGEAARSEAYETGYAEGLADGQAKLSAELAKLADAVAAIRADHEAGVAEAALAATTAIIGTLDDADIVTRIVHNQIAARVESDAIRISVAPQMIEALSTLASEHKDIEFIADPDLASTDCRITSGEGRIVADLSLQMGKLRQRWGLQEGEA
jgi:flagellar biosynthesis/type III secretory pathway protein FliH